MCTYRGQGLRVKLFEANDKTGGCCANKRLQGYTFNDGALYVAIPETTCFDCYSKAVRRIPTPKQTRQRCFRKPVAKFSIVSM